MWIKILKKVYSLSPEMISFAFHLEEIIEDMAGKDADCSMMDTSQMLETNKMSSSMGTVSVSYIHIQLFKIILQRSVCGRLC